MLSDRIKDLKKYGKFILLFIFIFCCFTFILWGVNYGDPIANYGFSYAIRRGEVPYLHFNTISTPLFAFFGTIGLFIWNNYTMFLLQQSLLVTVMFYLLEKLYGQKCYLLLAVSLILFGAQTFMPTYNFFCFFMMVVLLYLEEKYTNKDYLIGIFIGFAILSKHTFGGLLLLPSIIYYYKDKKKLLKRLIGMCIPCLLFFIYLLWNKALYRFIDLCFLGLFDFSSKNGNIFTSYFYVSMVCLGLSCYLFWKNKKDIKYLYLLLTFSVVIPLFDLSHFSLYFLSVLMMLLPYVHIKNRYTYSFVLIAVTFYLFSNLSIGMTYHPVFTTKNNHFEYILNSKKSYLRGLKEIEYIKSFKNPLILSYSKMQYDIINNYDLDYFDVFLYGNFGYHGDIKMIDKIKQMHNQIIIVDRQDYTKVTADSQFDRIIAEYAMKVSKKIDSKYGLDVYYKE